MAWAKAYCRAKWHFDPSAEKIFGPVSFFEGGAGCPSKTMWPKPRPISIPSSILNHLAVIHQRHRQDRQTGQTTVGCLVGWLEFNVPFQHKYGYVRDEDRQRSDSIRRTVRTVLQTVAQKTVAKVVGATSTEGFLVCTDFRYR